MRTPIYSVKRLGNANHYHLDSQVSGVSVNSGGFARAPKSTKYTDLQSVRNVYKVIDIICHVLNYQSPRPLKIFTIILTFFTLEA